MRTVDAAILAALSAPVVRCIYFVRLHFDSAVFAWHSGFGNIYADGYTYLGAGTLSTVSAVNEETGIKAASVSVGLSGVKPEIVNLMLTEAYINRPAYVHFVPLDDGDIPVSSTPMLLFRGSMDSISGQMGTSASFVVSLKSRLADWERPRKILNTDAQQQKLYPGDRGMEFIGQLSQKKLIWPRAAFLPDPRD